MIINFFADDEKLLQYLNPSITIKSPVHWHTWAPGQDIAPYFLLICPLRLNGVYISCEANWKKYLELHYPDCTFISAGFVKARHSNYIDMLEPPKNLEQFFLEASPAGANWVPVITDGMDMNRSLLRFFDGHGAESIWEVFSHLARILQIAEDEIKIGTEFEEIQAGLFAPNQIGQKWWSMKNRWSNYEPYFACLPFYPLLEEVAGLLSTLEPFFQSGCKPALLLNLNCTQKLERIGELLKTCSQYAYK